MWRLLNPLNELRTLWIISTELCICVCYTMDAALPNRQHHANISLIKHLIPNYYSPLNSVFTFMCVHKCWFMRRNTKFISRQNIKIMMNNEHVHHLIKTSPNSSNFTMHDFIIFYLHSSNRFTCITVILNRRSLKIKRNKNALTKSCRNICSHLCQVEIITMCLVHEYSFFVYVTMQLPKIL